MACEDEQRMTAFLTIPWKTTDVVSSSCKYPTDDVGRGWWGGMGAMLCVQRKKALVI